MPWRPTGSRPNWETVRILTSLLTGALKPEQDYRLPVPALLVHGQLDHLGDIALSTRVWAQREPLAEYAAIPGGATGIPRPGAPTRSRGAVAVADSAGRAAAATVGRPAARLRHQLLAHLTAARPGGRVGIVPAMGKLLRLAPPRVGSRTPDGGACAGHYGNRPLVVLSVETILSVTDFRSVIAPAMGSGYDRHAATYDHDTGHFNDFRERAVACVPQLMVDSGTRPGSVCRSAARA